MTQLEEQFQQFELISAEQNKKILELQQLTQSFSTTQPVTLMKTDVTTQAEDGLSSSTITDSTLDKLLESIQSLTSNFVPVRRRYSSSAAIRRRPESRISRVSSGCGSMFNEYEDVQDLLHNADMLEELESSAQHVESAVSASSSSDRKTTTLFQQEQALGSVLLAMEDLLHNIKCFRNYNT